MEATEDTKQTTEAKKLVEQWNKQLELAKKQEKDWLEDADKAVEMYRGEKSGKKKIFNAFYSNVETKRAALYGQPPRIDIRRRDGRKNPVTTAVSDLLTRALEVWMDDEEVNFHQACINIANNLLIPSRDVTTVCYKADMEKGEDEEYIAGQHVYLEQPQYHDYRRGPGNNWNEVPWEAFKLKLTKDEVEESFPDFDVDDLNFEAEAEGQEKESDGTIYKRAAIWKIWDKDSRSVIFIAEGYVEKPLDVQEDPLELRGFFPNPEPLRAIEDPTSLVPVTELSQYYILVEELETITKRMKSVANAIRGRGAYDSSMKEIEQILNADDNEMIAIEDTARFIEKGGIERGVFFMPNNDLANVFQILRQQRRDTLQEIYEITGISDIMRGASNPHETKGAQEIKASFGSGRLSRQQTAIQLYIRDILRLVAEVIAENFTRETLAEMTGLNFPTEDDHQRAQLMMQQFQGQMQQYQQMAQMAERAGQQPPPPPEPDPQIERILSMPTWEQIEEVLHDDFRRSYNVDIETDSTIAIDENAEKQEVGFIMKAIADFSATAAQAIQAQMIAPDAGRVLIKSMVTKFKLGREVEEAFSQPIPQPEGPSPEQIEAQREEERAQREALEAEKDRRHKEQMQAMETQSKQIQAALEAKLAAMEERFAEQEHLRKMDESARKEIEDQIKHMQKMQEARLKYRHGPEGLDTST